MAVVKTLIGNCKGPKGDPGEKGAQGAQGIAGTNGIRGSRIVSGIAITGTSTSPKAYATGISDSLVNDHYINTNNGNIYRCTKAGDASTAQWVFVGNVTSSNTFAIELGYMWEESEAGISDIRSIAGDGSSTLVAVGHNPDDVENGNIAFSINGGISWQAANIVPVKTALNSVTYSPHGYFVAVGENGTILKSMSSGDVWELVTEGPVEADSLRGVVWSDVNQMLVSVGGQGPSYGQYSSVILTSRDGQIWERKNSNIGAQYDGIINSIACDGLGAGSFAAVCGKIIVTSNDGETWSTYEELLDRAPFDSIASIKFNGNRYVGISNDGYPVFSGDGGNIGIWTTSSRLIDEISNMIFNDLEKIDGNVHVIVGLPKDDANNSIMYSLDEMNSIQNSWDELSDNDRSSEFTGNLLCVKYIQHQGTFIGKDDGKILKLKEDVITKNTTEAVEEMYRKLILQMS